MTKLKDVQESRDRVQLNLDEVFSKLLPTDADEAVDYSTWIHNKTDMRLNPNCSKKFPIIKKGIYYVNFGRNVGSEQEKDRPAVVLWSQLKATVAMVIPISDEYHGSTFWFHVHLSSGDTALVEQMRVVSKARIRTPVYEKGRIRELLPDELKQINDAIDKLKFGI